MASLANWIGKYWYIHNIHTMLVIVVVCLFSSEVLGKDEQLTRTIEMSTSKAFAIAKKFQENKRRFFIESHLYSSCSQIVMQRLAIDSNKGGAKQNASLTTCLAKIVDVVNGISEHDIIKLAENTKDRRYQTQYYEFVDQVVTAVEEAVMRVRVFVFLPKLDWDNSPFANGRRRFWTSLTMSGTCGEGLGRILTRRGVTNFSRSRLQLECQNRMLHYVDTLSTKEVNELWVSSRSQNIPNWALTQLKPIYSEILDLFSR